MKSVTISAYMMRVKSTKGDGGYYSLERIPSGQSLFKLLGEYLDQLGKTPAVDTDDQVLLRASTITKQGRSISGILQRGEYGINSELLDKDNHELSYKRSVRDAEMLPFYFLTVVPARGTRALIAFEVEGNPGIKLQFEDDFEIFLKRRCQDCELEIERLVPEVLMRTYFKDVRVTKVRFVRFTVPQDIADAVREEIGEEGAALELQVRPKRGTDFSIMSKRVEDILRGKPGAKDLVQVKGLEYGTLKVDFDMDGKRRTMNLTAPSHFRADYNVTSKVEMDGGHPSYLSIDAAAREIVRDIMSSLKLEAEGV